MEFEFPEGPISPEGMLATPDKIGSPVTVASAGGRCFSFVTGRVAGLSIRLEAVNQL